jgi:hypothetical protein
MLAPVAIILSQGRIYATVLRPDVFGELEYSNVYYNPAMAAAD